MTELFTMIVLAANIISASAIAKFMPMAATDAAAAHEQTSDLDTFEGRVLAKIQMRNARDAGWRDLGDSTAAYWGRADF